MTAFKYYLGLDMGTNSVGWAATDPEYRLLKAKGKDLWGIREFNEASGAVERRTHRISRRRKQREQVRIGILKDYFHDAICEVDPSFFQRLENSKYHEEDKDVEVRYKNNIFNDSNYTDKDYFNEYPTIYHLRNELISSTEKHDVRLVFLALLNMFKHRGHFLNAGLGENNGESNIDNAYFELTELLSELECIYNIFNINTNDRKIISKLYQELTYQNDALLQEESIRFKQELMEYFDKLISTVPYNLKYNFEVDLSSLMKAISVETDVECDSLLEKMLQYIKLMNQICGIDIFVIPNLKYYFSTEETMQFYQFAMYNKIYIVVIEPTLSPHMEGEKSWIIDDDLCIIEL